MRKFITAALVMTCLSLGACASDGYGGRVDRGENNKRFGNHDGDQRSDRRGDRRDHQRRDYLESSDRIYRSENGHYYCKRSDGRTGALVGATGEALGNVIAPGKSEKLGKILDKGGSNLTRRAIERRRIRCE